MSSRRKLSRSSKKLTLNLANRKLKLSKSIDQELSPCSLIPKGKSFSKLPVSPCVRSDLQEKNQNLRSCFEKFPLRRKFQYFREEMQVQRKELIVISKIEKFSQQYNKYYNNVYAKCRSVEWIIVSTAVNSEQVQSEFNSSYEPIKFLFLKNLSVIVNYFNFPERFPFKEVTLNSFSRIVNFQAYLNDFGCIFEQGKEKIKKMNRNSNELWLLDEKDLGELSTLNNYFFISHDALFNDYMQILDCSMDVVYILMSNYKEVLSCLNIGQIEKSLDKARLRQFLRLPMHEEYCRKVVQRYFMDEIVYCLIGFPQRMLSQVSKYFQNMVAFSENICFSCKLLFCIYYGQQKPRKNMLRLSYRKEAKLQNQVYRIKNYCEGMKKIVESYQKLADMKVKVKIFAFNCPEKQLVSQIQWLSANKIIEIDGLQDILMRQQSSMLVIGHFSNEQRQLFTSLPSVALIDIDQCDSNSLIIHNQIVVGLEHITKKEGCQVNLLVSPKVLSFNVDLPQFKSDPIYINKPISQFRETISSIQQNYHHIVIMEMSDYNQEREKKINQTEVLKNVSFEIYLKYGSQFIIRSQSSKYNFLKREELIAKIKEISAQHKKSYFIAKKQLSTVDSWIQCDYEQKISSTLLDKYYFEGSTLSTPNLYHSPQTQLFILVPKTLPYHSLINRSNHSYSLLLYSNFDQVHYFTKHLSKHHYAAVIIGSVDSSKPLQHFKVANCEYIKVLQFGEKQIRDKIDRVVQKFGLVKRMGSIAKTKKEGQIIVLYQCSDANQVKLILQMNTIFKQAKIIALSKKQFIGLKARYNLTEHLLIYEMGGASIAFSRRVRNIVDLLKVYMSPSLNTHQFSAGRVKFSGRQHFIREYYDKAKKEKFKGRLQEINLTRSISPRSNSLKGRQYVSEPGLTILQSSCVGNGSKRQTFSNKWELIGLVLSSLSKGNTVVIILSHQEQEGYQRQIDTRASGVIWIVVTRNIKYCLVRQSHLMFCLKQEVEAKLGQIVLKLKKYREREFYFCSDNGEINFQKQKIQVKNYRKWDQYVEDHPQYTTHDDFSLVQDNNLRLLSIEQLNETLIFKRLSKYQSVTRVFQKSSRKLKKENHEQGDKNQESVAILVQARNKHFIQQCLSILEEKNCVIVTYLQESNLLTYAQLVKTLLVLEIGSGLKMANCLYLSPADTPMSVSGKLGAFLQSLFKST